MIHRVDRGSHIRCNTSVGLRYSGMVVRPLHHCYWRGYTANMANEKICLKAVMVSRDGRLHWAGEYKCSACGVLFRPDPNDAGRLAREFADHVENEHAGERELRGKI